MKKILMMAAMMIATLSANAQNLSLKIQAGATFADITNAQCHDFKPGFIGGAELEYRASDLIGISGGLFYSMQGGKFNDSRYEIGNGKFDAKYNYLNVPILANFHVTQRLVLKAGLQPGFLLSAKEGGIDVKICPFPLESLTNSAMVCYSTPATTAACRNSTRMTGEMTTRPVATACSRLPSATSSPCNRHIRHNVSKEIKKRDISAS